jgi:hypothetical protein
MGTDLRYLFDSLRSVKDFYLLAVTTDGHFPQELNNVRLLGLNGEPPPNPAEKLFWMPIGVVKQSMEVWADGQWAAG